MSDSEDRPTSSSNTRRDPERRAAVVRADKARVWHPYTPMRRYLDEVDPLVVHRASGAWLEDLDGRRYLDANSSWYVAALGHGHPRLVAALAAQAERLAHTSLAGVTHEPAAMLAEELVAVAPRGLERVFYSDDGSTAVEVALKMAAAMWRGQGRPQRSRFVALEGAYHGDTIGASSLGGVEVFRRPFAGVLFDCIHVPRPIGPTAGPREHSIESAYERAFADLERAIANGADEIAAVVLEPVVQGASGMHVYDAGFVRRARELCDRHDTLLVFDEVFTGYGRTGPMWACDHAGVSPDLLCLGKGFTGGMLPMAATLVSARVFEAFLEPAGNAFWYGHSFCGNPLGAAIAREVLAVYRDERVLELARPKAEAIRAAFEGFGSIAGVSRVRSLGMMGALDLADDASYLGRRGWRVYDEARMRGAYLRPLGDTVYVTPPINIADVDLATLLSIVEESVRAAVT